MVRMLIRSFSDKEPLVKTLNKYVKIVRTEHCFLLFEELGKSDKWLQCLEVIQLVRVLSYEFVFVYDYVTNLVKFVHVVS